MFGIKINKNTVRRAFNNTKTFIGDAYHKTKGFLGDLDSGINTAKSIYSIIQPAMTSLLGDTHTNVANKYVMKNLNNYESIRNKVMDSEENINKHYQHISNELKKNKIDIGL